MTAHRAEFERVMDALQRQTLERKLAEPAVSFALHAVDCHHDMLAALKAVLPYLVDDEQLYDQVEIAIAKAEGES